MTASLKKLEAMESGSVSSVAPVESNQTIPHHPPTTQFKELHAVPRGGWLDGPGRFWGRT